MHDRESRRAFLTIASAGALLVACKRETRAEPEETAAPGTSASPSTSSSAPAPPKDEHGVGAAEDMMREHGVIRRVIVVYREAAARLRSKQGPVAPDALQKAAKVLRTFGEDYHEKQLEEVNVFPALMKGGGKLADMANVLIAQHQRGRELTDYVLAVTQRAIGAQAAEPLARALESFSRMYEMHAAIEDTIVFPAWKKTMSPKDLDEIGERFEDIERKALGKDAFEGAVDQIAAIEKSLGIDLAAMTAAPAPKG